MAQKSIRRHLIFRMFSSYAGALFWLPLSVWLLYEGVPRPAVSGLFIGGVAIWMARNAGGQLRALKQHNEAHLKQTTGYELREIAGDSLNSNGRDNTHSRLTAVFLFMKSTAVSVALLFSWCHR